MEREKKPNMKSRNHTCRNDPAGAIYLGKFEHTKRVMIHQHMMSHYRRLYGAKCDVDTSVPSHFKPRFKPQSRPSVAYMPTQNQLSVNEMKFLESLSSDVRMWCNTHGSRHFLIQCDDNNCMENLSCRSTSNRHEKCKIKKTESKMEIKKNSVNFSVPSKLREMSVYHPPRKKMTEKSSCKHCAWCPSSINSRHRNEVNKYVPPNSNEGNCNLSAEKVPMVMGIQKEKLKYLKFVQDITQDILNNEMFSNDDLEEICQIHVQLNSEKLEMDKMMEQIQILKKQLGINEESNSLRKNDNAYVLSEFVDVPRSESKGCEESLDVGNKLRFSPSVPKHTSKESQSVDNFKRNAEVNKQQISEHDNSNISNLLKCIGFDCKLIKEICMGINEQNNKRSNSLQNDTNQSELEVPDFSGPYEIGEFNGKSDSAYHDNRCCSCTSQKTSKVTDVNIIYKNKAAKIPSKPDNVQQKESRNRYQSPTDKKVKKNPTMKLGKQLPSKKKVTSKLSFSSSDVIYDERERDIVKTNSSLSSHVVSNVSVKESSKNHNYQENNKENSSAPLSIVSSPVASDYSSMKDHEESASEVYSVEEVSDEGRESASEVEEDIPDNISQTTSSSRMSQMTEQFKTISMNAGSELNTYNANISLRSKDNRSSFQQL